MDLFGSLKELVQTLFKSQSSDPDAPSGDDVTLYAKTKKLFRRTASNVDEMTTNAETQTLQNKSLGDAADATKTVVFDTAGATTAKKTTLDFNHTDDRTITFPDATDTVLVAAEAQTVTNKTITVDDDKFTLQDEGDDTKKAKFQLSGISGATTRTYTLPDVDDNLVTRTSTDTLTNKSLTSPNINTNMVIVNQATIDFREDSGSGTNVVKVRAPATLASDITLTWPTDDGGANEALTSDGAGNLSFQAVSITGAGHTFTDATLGGGSGDLTVDSGKTHFHPHITIATGDTYTINGRFLSEEATIDGSLVISGTARML